MGQITSAGIALVRVVAGTAEVLLGHGGGPYFNGRDAGAWGLPKGLVEPGESIEAAAKREFEEEVGLPLPEGRWVSLGNVRQSRGKVVHAWAVAGDVDVTQAKSNMARIEWPPHSGIVKSYPEVDRAEFFTLDRARYAVFAAQRPLVERALSWPVLEELFPTLAGR
jgi:predicted NUDIX family NTP pyrophosphohydrolase